MGQSVYWDPKMFRRHAVIPVNTVDTNANPAYLSRATMQSSISKG